MSLHKPYIRPIVRGKETKPVEFGIKVHKVQVGGINLIEHESYEAFNECKRLKISVLKHKNNFGKCTHISADRIYATNENRRFCTQNGIQTNFVRKGAGKDDKPTKKIKDLLNKQRSTSLEGSFGTEKEHYLLHKIKAQNPITEKVWAVRRCDIFWHTYSQRCQDCIKARESQEGASASSLKRLSLSSKKYLTKSKME